MKILITGAAGFLGTTLVEQLLANADRLGITEILGFDSLMFQDNGVVPLLRDKRFVLHIGDVRNEYVLAKLAARADVIYPLAGIVGAPLCAKSPQEADEVNRGHIETIMSVSPQKVLYPCTNSIYGNSGGTVDEDSTKRLLSVYAKTKYQGEELVLAGGGVSLRLATLAGLSYRQRPDLLVNTMCLKALTDGYVILYEPNFQRCYISVRDAARAFIYALEHYDKFKGKAFNCGNTALNSSKLQLAELIKKYVPHFLVRTEDFLKDPDQRDYKVLNDKLEATGFTCHDGFETILPEVLNGYKVMVANKRPSSI